MSEPVLDVQDVYKIHRSGRDGGEEHPVLRGVNLRVEAGEFRCVMGPSGSGKTTLLHLLSGLDQPSAGRILLGGVDLARATEADRTRQRRDQVGYVFQFFHLMPNLTVEENIALPVAIAGRQPRAAAARVRELARTLGIEERLGALPHELSGGEMQRASIARALIAEQPLLLCDEPTGNLSQSAGREVMEELRRAVDEEGRTVVLVTHNPRDATFADRVSILVDGVLDPDRDVAGPGITEAAVLAALERAAV
ncbi:MAG: ABC transporter ATP-binding protein [Planctomycetota bacterium]|nr:ABC transporter ATP-binding protein [Planctomycetota bacterium]